MSGSWSSSSRRARRLLVPAVGGLAVLLAAILGCHSGNRRNVVLVVVDTVRADRLGLYASERQTSPALQRWAAEGAVFERAQATSPWTLPSFGSILTGRLPSHHGAGMVTRGPDARAFPQLEDSVTPLAELLAGRGYATGAVVNNPFLDPGFGLARGFATYDYDPGDSGAIRRADVVVDRALAWVDANRGRPFFLLVHFFDPHMSYDPAPATRGRFTRTLRSRFGLPITQLKALRKGRLRLRDVDRDFVRAAYDEELLFVDMQLDRLFRGLRERGLLADSVVVLTADHGEELFDHGGFEHGHSMYEELLHVPLVVWGPGVRAGRRGDPVSIADVFPTVLEALELPAVEGPAGQSLWGAITRDEGLPERALVAEGVLYGADQKALIRWPYKLILEPETGTRRLYDLSLDPGEEIDLAPQDPARADSLLDELRDRVRTSGEEPARSGATTSAETREKLRALGYLE